MKSKSVLITAFDPFGSWQTNSSALCLRELVRDLPCGLDVQTRIYPVDFAIVREQLAADLRADFDFAIHLGQAQQTGRVRLESIAVNVGGTPGQPSEEFTSLVPGGPVAFQSPLPLADWAVHLRGMGIPAYVSFHAGTYLCNATLYWSHLFAEQAGLRTRSCFIHLPLDVSQIVGQTTDWPTLPSSVAAKAVRVVLERLVRL